MGRVESVESLQQSGGNCHLFCTHRSSVNVRLTAV